jgi:hypothetical protein
MDSLWKVGPKKPLGYLPLSTIKGYCGESLSRVMLVLVGRGLDVRVFDPATCAVGSGALYVSDREALQRLLDEHLATLLLAAWPPWASEFVQRVAAEWIGGSQQPALYTLIARAFGRCPESYEFEAPTAY